MQDQRSSIGSKVCLRFLKVACLEVGVLKTYESVGGDGPRAGHCHARAEEVALDEVHQRRLAQRRHCLLQAHEKGGTGREGSAAIPCREKEGKEGRTYWGAGDGLGEGGALEGRGVQVLKQQLVVGVRHLLLSHHAQMAIGSSASFYK